MLKSLILVISVATSLQAFAQKSATSSAEVTDIQAEKQVSVTKAPSLENPIHLTLGSENFTYESAQRAYEGKAPAYSSNWVGALYDINKMWSLELRQYFMYVANKENLTGRDKQINKEDLALAETMLKIGAKTNWSLLGSKPVNADFRYYAPTDRASQENKELGRLRSDTSAEWMLNPNWSVTAWLSPRVLLNSANNPNTVKGADAEFYQVKLAPILTYYVNDKISTYYSYTFNEVYSQAQRGDWTPDQGGNVGTHEVGAWMNWGALSFNPSLMSDTNLANREGSLFTSESRAFSYETLIYNLNLYATF